MTITETKEGSTYYLYLNGRLDANWHAHLEEIIELTIRKGEHHIALHMQEVNYISSAGIRSLIINKKKLHAIEGNFFITSPSQCVEETLTLAGLEALLTIPEELASSEENQEYITIHSPSAQYHLYTSEPPPVGVQSFGNHGALHAGANAELKSFSSPSFGIGIGALGAGDNRSRLGELIAVAGNVAYSPTDGSNTPDYIVKENNLTADGQLLTGLLGSDLPSGFARFEGNSAQETVSLSEIASTLLNHVSSDAVIIIGLTETAGLIGTTIQQSPAQVSSDTKNHFDFPQIRDWLSYSDERTHRDSTSLVVGVAGPPWNTPARAPKKFEC